MIREQKLPGSISLESIQFQGYFPGAIGLITALHGAYYFQNWGLDSSFEAQVGRELSEFILEFQEDRDRLWMARYHGQFAGSIALDGRHVADKGARIRWFIVAPEFQGLKLGHALIQQAIQFCQEKQYPKIYLWTFSGLDAAHHLYRSHGFYQVEERPAEIWGRSLQAQRFERILSL